MEAFLVVVLLPFGEASAGFAKRREKRLVQELVPQPPVEASMKAFCVGLPGAM